MGLLPWLTAGGALAWKQPLGENALLGDEISLAGFARARLREGAAGDPLSVQLWVETPVEAQEGESRSRRTDEPSVELRLQYGRGFATPLGPGWVDLGAGYRANLDAAADQLRLDLTTGVRPAEDWLVMLQSFNTIGLRNPDLAGDLYGEDYDVYKIAPSVGYDLGPATVLFGLEREVAGRNLDALGTRWRVSIWREF